MARKEASLRTAQSAQRKSKLAAAIVALVIIAACVAIKFVGGNERATANPPAAQQQAPRQNPAMPQENTRSSQQNIVAIVNGEPIYREELARECLSHYGKQVLESIIYKQLITQYCQQHNVTVTRQEVNAEIEAVAKRFNLPVDHWLKMLKQERGVEPAEYADHIIWPMLALKKLAAAQLTVSEQELQEAYLAYFGEAVKCRMIACRNRQKAEQLRAQVLADPESFGSLAKSQSEDLNSASAEGWVPPIRRHVGDSKVEEMVFGMTEGQISEIIEVGGMFAFAKCEGRLPAQDIQLDAVRDRLAEKVREGKMRKASGEVFQQIQAASKVVNVFNDPALRDQNPGVAAFVNNNRITVRDLAEECISRHGEQVIDGTINRRLLEQSLKSKRITVSDDDVQAEIGRAASALGKTLPNGEPDIEGWVANITQQQGITRELYIRDSVWPSVALKKIVGEVEISAEDIDKGFVANYGPRARVRAIVLSNQRLAQEVWEKARTTPTSEHFAKLAEKYSVEASSKSLGGKVPPLRRYGGQPMLEDEAFRLKPGELSSIIQAGDKYVILLCEGFTEPAQVDKNEVAAEIHQDIHEKKVRLAMAAEFERLREVAQIDNFLAGTSQSPKKGMSPDQVRAMPGNSRDSNVRPASAQQEIPQGIQVQDITPGRAVQR